MPERLITTQLKELYVQNGGTIEDFERWFDHVTEKFYNAGYKDGFDECEHLNHES